MTIVPYKLLVASLRSDGDMISIPRSFLDFLLCEILKHAPIDEETYLALNPDVAASVRRGEWNSGKDHFVARGYFEDRDGAIEPLSVNWYLRTNPDVANAVKAGIWDSGESHYYGCGILEWRAPNKELQEVFAAWSNALQLNKTANEESETVVAGRTSSPAIQ